MAGVAPAQAATHKATSKLTAVLSPATVLPHSAATIAGTVTPRGTGVVVLQRYLKGTWVQVSHKTAGKTGALHFHRQDLGRHRHLLLPGAARRLEQGDRRHRQVPAPAHGQDRLPARSGVPPGGRGRQPGRRHRLRRPQGHRLRHARDAAARCLEGHVDRQADQEVDLLLQPRPRHRRLRHPRAQARQRDHRQRREQGRQGHRHRAPRRARPPRSPCPATSSAPASTPAR